jgi:hypothetical protein
MIASKLIAFYISTRVVSFNLKMASQLVQELAFVSLDFIFFIFFLCIVTVVQECSLRCALLQTARDICSQWD